MVPRSQPFAAPKKKFIDKTKLPKSRNKIKN